jgi:hypothetical protein
MIQGMNRWRGIGIDDAFFSESFSVLDLDDGFQMA